MGVNIKYKDSVFSLLFSEPDILRELYCALEGVTLPADTPVTINTLQDALFKGLINDVSFEIGGKLIVLVEHQSTINPNMAVRLLMYIARVYEKLLGDRNMYGRKQLLLHRPEFFVLYNGLEAYPAEQVLKLSDSYEETASLGIGTGEAPALELVVRVLNINEGVNAEIVSRCKTLGEYSGFVAKVREYEKRQESREAAVQAAIVYCRKHGILQGFLELHGTEVLNMLLSEWNWDDALAVSREEGVEEGLERGLEEGLGRGVEKVARNALKEGASYEFIQKITGLDTEAIRNIQISIPY